MKKNIFTLMAIFAFLSFSPLLATQKNEMEENLVDEKNLSKSISSIGT